MIVGTIYQNLNLKLHVRQIVMRLWLIVADIFLLVAMSAVVSLWLMVKDAS